MNNTLKTQKDLYQQVTDKIIKALESNIKPWRKTWATAKYGIARNYKSQHEYSGINFLLMNLSPHEIPYFLTFKQIKEMGGKLKKGAKSEQVYFYNRYYKDNQGNKLSEKVAQEKLKAGEKIDIMSLLKYYNVFSISDVEEIEFDLPKIEVKDNEPIQNCEALISNMKDAPTISYEDKNSAFYHPIKDILNMPQLDRFDSSEAYYSVLFHELIHSTGHESRLNRNGIIKAHSFQSKEYAKEELIAEIGSSFLAAYMNVNLPELEENSASYIKSWLSLLKSDKKFIFKAAAKASKAANFILS